jgi:hypothetical protein
MVFTNPPDRTVEKMNALSCIRERAFIAVTPKTTRFPRMPKSGDLEGIGQDRR